MREKTDFVRAVENTAILAKLNLSQEKKEQYAKEIEEILNHFQDINDLEVGQVKDFDHYSLSENKTRVDKKENFSEKGKGQIKSAFPQRKGEYLKVKAVL